MQEYESARLTPLFWSEISSSYMLHDVFSNHQDIAVAFIKKFIGIDLDKINKIHREFVLLNKGSADLMIEGIKGSTSVYILIEVKIHDYASATKEQIRDYFSAALEKFDKSSVYFMYLTEFSSANFTLGQQIVTPPTLEVFDYSRKNAGKYQDNLVHVNWQQVHEFLNDYRKSLSQEEALIVELQKQWISGQALSDLTDNTVKVGDRDLSEYFSDLNIDIKKELGFGQCGNKKGVSTYKFDLSKCAQEQLTGIIDFLRRLLTSENIDQKNAVETKEETLKAAKDFLAELSQDESRWALLAFYAALFGLINERSYVRLYGTGASGFSLKVRIKGKSEISLCTLWCHNKDILEFFLKR